MTLLFMDGFDHYTAAQGTRKWQSAPTKMMTGRFGVGQAGLQNGQFTGGFASPMISNNLGNQQVLIVGFALWIENYDRTDRIWQFLDGAISQVELRLDSFGYPFFTRNGTALGGPAANNLLLNTWYFLEAKIKIHPTDGYCILRVAEQVVINVTGVNTRNTANNWVNRLYNDQLANWPGRAYDDLWVCNDQGFQNADFLGDCRIETLYPTGEGGLTQWSPSAGANFACVDEDAANDDADYVSATGTGQKDLYQCSNLVTTTGLVRAIQPVLTARLGNAGGRTICAVERIAGSDVDGPNLPLLSSSYLMYPAIQELNPATGLAWAISEVNSSEFGMRVIA